MHKDEVVLVQAVTALTVGWDMVNRMQRGELWGTVHSVFRRAFNFIGQDGELYAVTSASLGPAPNSVVVAGGRPGDASMDWTGVVKPEVPVVSCGSDWLLLGDGSLMVSLRGAPIWRAWGLPRPMLPASEVDANLRLAGRLVAGRRDAEFGSIYPCLVVLGNPWVPQTLPALAKMALPAANELAVSWLAGEPTGIRAAAARLAGLGPGLTPSGDDFLTGFMAATAMASGYHPLLEERVRWVNRQVTEIAVPGANPITRAQLTYAARGQPPAVVQRCVDGLFCGSRRQAARGIKGLMKAGATSGVDLLVGIGLGCRVVLKYLEALQ